MPDEIELQDLNAIPDAETIRSFREQAAEEDTSVGATFPAPDGTQKRLIVSARGTCVLLNDVTEETFHHSLTAEEIARDLRG